MKQQNIFITTLIVFIACISFSCQPALGSAWYRSSAPQGRNSGQHNIEEEEQQAPKDPNAFIEVEPFKYFTKDYLYPASKFDDWVLYMTGITKTNIASYKFDSSEHWTNNSYGEYKYEGISGKGAVIGENQQNHTTNLSYYMYKNRTDRWRDSNQFVPSLDEQETEKQKRFYFYRFKGTTTGNSGSLDNSTFCVDTYSKFLFFYSEPAGKQEVYGNIIPSRWTDYAADSSDHHIKRTYEFYKYDPVGFVKQDGSVFIYSWFKNKIANSDYSPVMNEKFKYAAKAGENPSPGHSPYKYDNLKIYGNEDELDNNQPPVLRIAPVKLKNISINGLHWTWYVIQWVSQPGDPLFSYSFKAKVSYDGYTGNTEELAEYNHGNSSSKLNSLKVIKPDTQVEFTPKLFQKEIPQDTEGLEAELVMQIIKYNSKTELGINQSTEEKYITKFDNSIKLTYDKKDKKWYCPAADKIEVIPGVKMSYPAFSLKRGGLKTFKINFESTQDSAEGEVEVSYMIGWQ
ncbi:hypothetical protein [Treponema pedis]|uniref:hypothetical protein n=1 Tax=Treponema pedis TaxID=409322 RepID=UPI00040D7AE5|nr:hypothetical protein [Treponema pedis]